MVAAPVDAARSDVYVAPLIVDVLFAKGVFEGSLSRGFAGETVLDAVAVSGCGRLADAELVGGVWGALERYEKF